jgi:hypothetical protein
MVAPNGEWVAETSFEQTTEEFRVQFKVYRADGTQTWSIVDYYQDGLGYTYTRLHHWSHDSRYFCFSSFVVADGGCHDFFPALSEWQRLDVNTGAVSDYALPAGRGHALSPDDTRLVYASEGAPVEIIWRDMASGAEQSLRLPLPEPVLETAQAGRIVWSPTGESVVVAAASHNTLCSEIRPEFSLWRINLDPPEVVALVEPNDILIWPFNWAEPEKLLVGDWNQLSWWMDAETGETTTGP